MVTTLQAVSGAGYPGVASLDILGNVIPAISGEEEKIESETQKILGTLRGDAVSPHPMVVSATTTRVPVSTATPSRCRSRSSSGRRSTMSARPARVSAGGRRS